MKKALLLILAVSLMAVQGCGKEHFSGSYSHTTYIGDTALKNSYDFNTDGTVFWTTSNGEREKGTYTVEGKTILLKIVEQGGFPRQVTLIREGNVLMRGNDRFVRE